MIVKMKNNKNIKLFSIEVPKMMLYKEFKQKVKSICGNDLDVDMIKTEECWSFLILGFLGEAKKIEFLSKEDVEYVQKHGSSPYDVTPISA